ncbi:hypothetical protein SAMN05444287_1680 [Octadecabacter temperatus]|uniref:Uncharacterized protein n=1 Tax=Octadecabacter temperatus TaxID=1458307 RepID=A0A0K0Y6G1_9RHOB|nr:hypothetical protein [Octadecabacter temperatus]AKS46563.1 hypothetical protein OSB_20240 [Octadecabacter temperatus]SIO16684.1 hypothetical protein SAMN05444287_1680 [Octadecabacter temperatus]
MEFLADLAALFIRFTIGVMRVVMRLIGFGFSKTWIASHAETVRNWGVALTVVMVIYLTFGVMRAAVPALATPWLTLLYEWPVIIFALIACLVGLTMSEWDVTYYDPDPTMHAFKPDELAPAHTAGPVTTPPTRHGAGIVALIFLALVIGAIFSGVTSQRHEASLAEKLCAQADARISDGAEQAVRDGEGLLDRVLGTQTADRIPCADD